MTDPRRGLPAVTKVLEELSDYPPALAEVAVRDVLADLRRELEEGRRDVAPAAAEVAAMAREQHLRWAGPTLTPVINATGVLIHTNLGRSPLGPVVREAILAALGYCDLEYDLAEGRRSTRQLHVELLLRAHTGAEAALVVNNNAAGVLLMLSTLAAPGEVVISRGELVEIGGSFRIPDVMALSGARLREVGTTNRTRLADYERAIGPETTALLKVHRSNFTLRGFVEEASLSELRPLAEARGLYLLVDAGSGALFPIGGEPSLREELAHGADVIGASGDKLLGAGQAGILVGRRALVDRMKRHPLYRALRPDKLTLAALKATLFHALVDRQHVRLWQMFETPEAELERRVAGVLARLAAAGVHAERVMHGSVAGGGSLPAVERPGPAVALTLGGATAGRFHELLRRNRPAVVARVEEGQLVLDLRTVAENEEADLVAAVERAWRALGL
jgi:L-seryl-tRNA(Ser) seleniumtransferase